MRRIRTTVAATTLTAFLASFAAIDLQMRAGGSSTSAGASTGATSPAQTITTQQS